MVSARLLREFPGFTKALEHSVRSIAVMSDEKHFRVGEVLFEEGEYAKDVCILLDGRVDLLMFLGGRNSIIDTVRPVGFLCWSALLDPFVVSATGIARQPSRVLKIDGSELRWTFERDPSLGFYMMRAAADALCSRMKGVRARLASIQ